jgi:hypothetical protein
MPLMKYWTVHGSLETSIMFKYYFRPTLACLFCLFSAHFRMRSSSCRLYIGWSLFGDPLSAKYIAAEMFGMLASKPLENYHKGVDSLKSPTALHITILLNTRSHVQDQRQTNRVQARVSWVCGSKSPTGL